MLVRVKAKRIQCATGIPSYPCSGRDADHHVIWLAAGVVAVAFVSVVSLSCFMLHSHALASCSGWPSTFCKTGRWIDAWLTMAMRDSDPSQLVNRITGSQGHQQSHRLFGAAS